MKKIAIYGAGGFGKEVACVLSKINELKPTWEFIGFFDDNSQKGKQISNYGSIIGNIDDLNNYGEKLAIVFAIGKSNLVESILNKIINNKIYYPNIIHPDVFFADLETFKIGIGNIIVRGCSFSVDTSIGNFNHFNSLSALAHDVKVGSFNIFMPLTRVSGEVNIGSKNTFGLNTLILQRIKIGNNTRTGPGSVIMKKTKDGNLYMGNPAIKTIL